jgi:hypothetical protein
MQIFSGGLGSIHRICTFTIIALRDCDGDDFFSGPPFFRDPLFFPGGTRICMCAHARTRGTVFTVSSFARCKCCPYYCTVNRKQTARKRHDTMYHWSGFTYNADGSLTTPKGKTLTAQFMACLALEYKGCNRIHKPFALLFWQDCKNGKASNWKVAQ